MRTSAANACRLTAAAAFLLAGTGRAGVIGDYLDTIDFNDYALSFNYYTSQSLYTGIDDTSILYPMLSSFESSTLTDDPLFVRDAYVGLRTPARLPWTFGVVGTVYTDGFGPTSSDAVAGMANRGWTLGAGLLVGRALGPVRADLFASTDILGQHAGQLYALKIAWPLAWPNLEIIPQFEITQYSSRYVDHYFGVEPAEATANRPAYEPGGGTGYTPSLHATYRIGPNWFIRASASYEVLPDVISNSPVVDRDSAWRFSLGIAYDTGNFVQMHADTGQPYSSDLDISVEGFLLSASTTVVLEGSDDDQSLRLEGSGNLDKRTSGFPVAFTWRFGRWHSLGLNYFEIVRDGSLQIQTSRRIGERNFVAGDVLRTSLGTKILQADYGFSIFRDAQKELTVLAGLYGTRIEYGASTATENVEAQTNAILPMFGARLRANFTDRLSLHIECALFMMDFDQYSGNLVDIAASGRYWFGRRTSIGAGYRVLRQSLDSNDDSFVGNLRIDYAGPFVSFNATLF